MIVVYSLTPRIVGTTQMANGLTDAFGELTAPQPVHIMCEATYEEWVDCVLRDGGNPYGWPRFPYYYQIHTD